VLADAEQGASEREQVEARHDAEEGVRRRSDSPASVLGGGIPALRRWSSRTCGREMVSTWLSELFCRRDEKSPATPKHATSRGGRAAAPMEDGGGNNAREEDGREVPVELAEVPSRTARSLGCCSLHQAVLARDEEGAVCRMDLPEPTTSVGTRTDYSVGPWDYSACATRHLKAWSTRTTKE
jgi:hypothetical protein